MGSGFSIDVQRPSITFSRLQKYLLDQRFGNSRLIKQRHDSYSEKVQTYYSSSVVEPLSHQLRLIKARFYACD